LTVQGLYFSDSYHNNNAQILNNAHDAHDVNQMRGWFHDIFILDRGYQDAQPLLREADIQYKMPAFLNRHQKQLFTEETNES